MPVALITGASRGFGRAVAEGLANNDWDLVVDARDDDTLQSVAQAWPGSGRTTAVAGDVADQAHREELSRIIRGLGRLDLLVNNASELGPSPQPQLDAYPLDELERVYRINTLAPLAIVQLVLPELVAARGAIVNVSSDAAVEAYPSWGGYGSSKAALDQLTAVLAAEQPALAVYAFDPGDMRTTMQQQAFPYEDISDRPEPHTVVPTLLRLIEQRPPSGRYRSADLLVAQTSR
ncbi:MAG TPA: SDR family oxidoreductase [Actinomycetota bacterium]|nr:SDR family oxidoreductase [Actinomycetota bacterium]